MFNREVILPPLLGLGLFAQTNEINLANNTTMLLLLFVLLEDHEKIENIERRFGTHFPYERNCFPHYGRDFGHHNPCRCNLRSWCSY